MLFFLIIDYNCSCNENIDLIIKKNGKEYNMFHISEYMESEITCFDDGWIQKFSEI